MFPETYLTIETIELIKTYLDENCDKENFKKGKNM